MMILVRIVVRRLVRKYLQVMTIAGLTGLAACSNTGGGETAEDQALVPDAVLQTYVEIARAGYGDSLALARELEQAVEQLLASPSQASLTRAREAWLAARVPYQQTEVYRFGNPVVDAWEGQVNAWPLDEGLIDYVDTGSYGDSSDFNYFYTANVIANPQLDVAGVEVDARDIDPALLRTLHEIDGVEANVASGYHAIEFLLWGQDLHGTEPGAGERPWTDYSLDDCSHGHCERRRDYLLTATRLLVSDLEEMVESWQPDGEALNDLRSKGRQGGLATILTGMGSLSYGELAGERTRLGLLLGDPEEEHDCFSDNTHNSHFYDAVGIENVYRGHYERTDGSTVSGSSLQDMVEARDEALAVDMEAALAETRAAMQAMVDAAEAGQPFDVLIAPGNTEGERIVNRVIDSLVAQTRVIERIITTLDLESTSIEGSDSLDNPELVF